MLILSNHGRSLLVRVSTYTDDVMSATNVNVAKVKCMFTALKVCGHMHPTDRKPGSQFLLNIDEMLIILLLLIVGT